MSAQYVPGRSAVAVRADLVVMAAGDRAADLTTLVDRSASPLEVLSLLSGGDVARLPEFAAAVADGDGVVVLVRGDFEVTAGGETWSGTDAATWREHRVEDDHDEVTLSRSGRTGRTDVARLPIQAGVVLADRVAWRRSTAPATAPAPVPATAAVTAAGSGSEHTLNEEDTDLVDATDFDQAVGATIQGRLPAEPAVPARPGDHDGRTVTPGELQRIREESGPGSAEGRDAPGVATLTLSTGEVVELAQPVVIGRSPRPGQLSGAQLPQLVAVADPYVSGTHLEITVEDGAVVAVDRSTNGTTLVRPGRDPERLAKDEPTVLSNGCLVALSDDLTATVAVPGADR